MENTASQIAKTLFEKNKIAIFAHARPDGDCVSSALALAQILQKAGKNTQIFCADEIPENLKFLPQSEKFQKKEFIAPLFKINLNCENTEISKVEWQKNDQNLEIKVFPQSQKIDESKISFSQNFGFDCIAVVDCADRAQLGNLFLRNPEIFDENLVVNIDHHISNQNYGNLNLIDPLAASATEVIFEKLLPEFEKLLNRKLLDENLATLILCGIITDTGSFQNANSHAKSFEISAKLIEAGADQQKIIRAIFKTKPLPMLKLWGEILANIRHEPRFKFAYSTIRSADLQKTAAKVDDARGVLDTLLSNAPGCEIVLLISERDEIVAGSVRTNSFAIDANAVAQLFGGGGHPRAAGFKVSKNEKSFDEVVEFIVGKVREFQNARFANVENENIAQKNFGKNNENLKKELFAQSSSKFKVLNSSDESPEVFEDFENLLGE